MEWVPQCDTGRFSDQVMITTVQLNEHNDPLEDHLKPAGYERCGASGDFNDIIVDQHGRVWFGLTTTLLEKSVSSAPWPRGRTSGGLVVWFRFHSVGTRLCESGINNPSCS